MSPHTVVIIQLLVIRVQQRKKFSGRIEED